jgi:4-hydroxybenzoate polyprenyltransferase
MRDYVLLARPWQWTKNVFCVAGLVFAPAHLSVGSAYTVFLITISFCFVSSAVYVFNDLLDRDLDAKHPIKKSRPIAAGRVSKGSAVVYGLSLLIAGAMLSYQSHVPGLIFVTASFVLLNIGYTVEMKNVAILDVFCISTGFILRLVAGILAIGDTPTAWIVACTFFLSLFLGFNKRRGELSNGGGAVQRPSLEGYSFRHLDMMIASTAAMTIITYCMFTLSGNRDPTLLLTALPVVFGVLHYWRQSHLIKALAETPDLVVLKDRVLITTIVIWLASFWIITKLELHVLR